MPLAIEGHRLTLSANRHRGIGRPQAADGLRHQTVSSEAWEKSRARLYTTSRVSPHLLHT